VKYLGEQKTMDNMKFAVIGGDMRQAKLAELLAADGHNVSTFAIDKIKPVNVIYADSAEAAAKDAQCVVLPLPIAPKSQIFNAPLSESTHTVETIFKSLKP